MEQSLVELSIVLPAYKEKENLAILIPAIEQEFKNTAHEIIIVDDHSLDGTRELLEDFQKTYGNIILIERAGLMGIGSALRDGYNRAQGHCILSSDADCSFSTNDMRKIVETFKEKQADIVLGYRVDAVTESSRKHAASIKGWCENHIISPLSNTVIGIISGMGLKNYNTNFRAIRTSLWHKIQTKEDRQFFLFEVIFRSIRLGAKIYEIPVTFSPRHAGESKVSFFKQAPKYLFMLIRMAYFDR